MTTPRVRAKGNLLQETERVIITEWRLAPGEETGWHEHNIVNPGRGEFAFIEIELK